MQPMKLKNGSHRIARHPKDETGQDKLKARLSLEKEMEAWRRNSRWVDETPVIEVNYFLGIDILMLRAALTS